MKFNIEHTIDILNRTPIVLSALLADIPDVWAKSNEGVGTWSPYENVAHLIHGEHKDWIPRLKHILEHGEKKTFTPFDPSGLVAYTEGKTLSELLNTFRSLRSDNLEELAKLNLKDEDFDKTGSHPAFGTVSVRQLLSTWTVHDLGHIAQITRVMAKQYKSEAGPWTAYLPIVTR
ncbi:MAG: DinB family protein [bacterium]|nr:DinB family protein [bacterium]